MQKRLIHLSIIFFLLCPALVVAQNSPLETQLKKAIEGKKAEIGIAVIIDGQDTITVNNDIHYPMMSVFKFHQALALADSEYILDMQIDVSVILSVYTI